MAVIRIRKEDVPQARRDRKEKQDTAMYGKCLKKRRNPSTAQIMKQNRGVSYTYGN